MAWNEIPSSKNGSVVGKKTMLSRKNPNKHFEAEIENNILAEG